jgi:hypothetical protein
MAQLGFLPELLCESRLVPDMSQYTQKLLNHFYRVQAMTLDADRETLIKEIATLRDLLSCALNEHDGNEGEFDPNFMPNHWTHSARKILATFEQTAGNHERSD